ncbi:MAG: hypothetical protein ACJAVV_001693 [Alphaproteobacteria bacterium]|jgi:hypothetical protein
MQEYPIGRPGIPWNEDEKSAWLHAQNVKRSYADEVLLKLDNVSAHFTKKHYGSLSIDAKRYPLYAFVTTHWDAAKPSVLVTGGVHGYETSGVQGAIDFLFNHAPKYLSYFNLIIVPCVSPWGYETVNRWTTNAVDPNRSFHANSQSPEAQQIMDFVNGFITPTKQTLLAHFDLHETTDTDNSEFRPAMAARDGLILDEWEVPDGFYTVANTSNPQLPFQKAVIASVEKHTHIAPSDANGQIIGSDVVSPGVICYDKLSLFLCGGFTGADYVTTTEVYPDSPNATPQKCIEAQVAAITGGLDFLSTNR